MMVRPKAFKQTVLLPLLALVMLGRLSHAFAAPLIETIETTTEAGCNQIHIRTAEPVVFEGSTLASHGAELRIPLSLLSESGVTAQQLTAEPNTFGYSGAGLEIGAAGKVDLVLRFATTVDHSIIMEAETRHIRVDVAGQAGANGCTTNGPTVANQQSHANQSEPLPLRTVSEPEPPDAPPDDISIAPPAKIDGKPNTKLEDNSADLKTDLPATITLRSMGRVSEPVEDPTLWRWTRRGHVGQTMIATSDTLPSQKKFSNDTRILATTTLFAEMTGGDDQQQLRVVTDARANANWQEHETIRGLKVRKLFGSWQDKQSGLQVTMGRQPRQDAGVVGRFDGLALDWQTSPDLQLGVLAGAPIYDVALLPFDDGRAFGGAHLSWSPADSPFKSQFYFIEQRIHGAVDRRAVGANISFDSHAVSSLFGIDFDIYQMAVTSASWQGTWRPNDRLSLTLAADYLTQPLLLTSNALIGRSETNFPDLQEKFEDDRVKQLATDRTSKSASTTFDLVYDVNDTWQLALDASWYNISGTPASGGVNAEQALGHEVAIGLHAFGQDILRSGDTVTLGMATRLSANFDEFAMDGAWRFPLTEDLTLSARMKTGVRKRNHETTGFFIIPDFAADYELSESWSANAAFGMSFDVSQPAGSRHEFIALMGINHRF